MLLQNEETKWSSRAAAAEQRNKKWQEIEKWFCEVSWAECSCFVILINFVWDISNYKIEDQQQTFTLQEQVGERQFSAAATCFPF